MQLISKINNSENLEEIYLTGNKCFKITYTHLNQRLISSSLDIWNKGWNRIIFMSIYLNKEELGIKEDDNNEEIWKKVREYFTNLTIMVNDGE